MRQIVLLLIILAASQFSLSAKTHNTAVYFLVSNDTLFAEVELTESDALVISSGERPNPVFKHFKKKHRLNKRITAAVLAFPFPFGIVGLHRIYLGTKPYVPVAYIASLGGVFGILPFIDFCAITFDKKNFEHYRENGQVFMWLNH